MSSARHTFTAIELNPIESSPFSTLFAVVELACGEYGQESIKLLVDSMDNGDNIAWFEDPKKVLKLEVLRQKYPIKKTSREDNNSMQAIPFADQLQILMRRGFLKAKRDATLTHLR